MAFGDLKSDSGLNSLNDHLTHKSYVEGYQPSQADVAAFEALSAAPAADKYPHALRWYNHIKSFSKSEQASFPGQKGAPKAAATKTAAPAADDDDDVDLFGSDDEPDEEAEKAREERLKAYAEKKAKKPGVIAKSSVILDVKPWDDETDMKELEKCVRSVGCDGLVWGVSKLVPLAYGIHKLQIVCVVEDEKVSIDWLSEEIQNFEDYVQSVDVAAFQKI
ncbi:elongation factor 1-beta-like [Ornithodoros turicata]|uniref:Elongation factor 1-beta n=1 Tax=Ornithodoros turicata TaxID=34597 RepID=A0A2R5LFG5_9ACAR